MRLAKRCLKIHSLFDLHTDTPTRLFEESKTDYSFLEGLMRQVQVASIYVPQRQKNPYTYYRNVLKDFLWRNTLPVNRIGEDKTVLLSLECGAPFEADIRRLYSIKQDGISSVMLTWNYNNSLAGGALDTGGLTVKGINAIKIMNEAGLALDLSHLNEKSLIKAAEKADIVLASHSNSKAVRRHPRNLSDDALKIIKDKGGIVGINLYPEFLGVGDVFYDTLAHIEHMLDLGLSQNIAIGSDLDGCDADVALKKTEHFFDLYSFLKRYLGDEKLLCRIFFDNAYAFYQKLFDKQSIML